jgi:hypothetical protein
VGTVGRKGDVLKELITVVSKTLHGVVPPSVAGLNNTQADAIAGLTISALLERAKELRKQSDSYVKLAVNLVIARVATKQLGDPNHVKHVGEREKVEEATSEHTETIDTKRH